MASSTSASLGAGFGRGAVDVNVSRAVLRAHVRALERDQRPPVIPMLDALLRGLNASGNDCISHAEVRYTAHRVRR